MVDLLDLYDRAFSPVLEAEEHRRYPDSAANRHGIEEYVALLQAADAFLLIYPTLVVRSAGHDEGLARQGLGPRRGIPPEPWSDPAVVDQHPSDRGRDYLWITELAALVHWLAGPAYDRPRSEAALRPALPT